MDAVVRRDRTGQNRSLMLSLLSVGCVTLESCNNNVIMTVSIVLFTKLCFPFFFKVCVCVYASVCARVYACVCVLIVRDLTPFVFHGPIKLKLSQDCVEWIRVLQNCLKNKNTLISVFGSCRYLSRRLK